MHQINQNSVEVNDEPQGTFNKINQIRFKTSVLRSSICDYSDAFVLVKGTTTVANTAAQDQIMPPIKR